MRTPEGTPTSNVISGQNTRKRAVALPRSFISGYVDTKLLWDLDGWLVGLVYGV
jgi:hypothetical protein